MVFFFYFISFLEFTGAFVIPNYYPVYVGFNPLNQAVLNQIRLANINNHNPHHSFHHTPHQHHHNLHQNHHLNPHQNHHHIHHQHLQQMNHGNMFNQQDHANNYHHSGNKEGGVTGSDLNVHSGHVEGENAGSHHENEEEKNDEGKHEETDSGKLEEQSEAGKKNRKKKLKKGFHDVYKKREKKSRNKFWNNYDRKGSYYKSKTDDGEHHEEVAGKGSDFDEMDLEKRIKDGDWDNGFVMSWKMKLAPNGTYVKYDQDFKEGYFDPSWSQDYIE